MRKLRYVTLDAKIKADLEAKILTGRWPSGFRIPFEYELMEKYDCSRMTVHKALSALATRGLIKRKRRAGSFVQAPPHNVAVLEIPDIERDILQRKQRYGYLLISRRDRLPKRGNAVETELSHPGRVLDIECVHYENDVPFAFEKRLISLATVPAARDVDFKTIAPGTWLLSHVPWSEAEHTIGAISADGELATRLNIPKDSACLSLERRTWTGGKAVTHVTQIFPGTRHSLKARFQPAAGG